jgi:hypothetical protein
VAPKTPTPPYKILVLICQSCEWSIPVKRGELPARCPGCHRQPGDWRVALAGEFTRRDREMLRKEFIKPD